jgi:hypothetical protein
LLVTKKIAVKPKPRTHFEQVAVKVVKKIVERDEYKTPKAQAANVILEPASEKSEPYSIQFAHK